MEPQITRILVPTDFSSSSQRAADYAGTLARSLGAAVHFIHVLDVSQAPEMAWAPAREAAAMYEQRSQEGLTTLAALTAAFERRYVPATSEVRTGALPSQIVQAAIDNGADLIVMTTHGRSGLSHLVLGSVAEYVIRHASCPVLAVRDSGLLPLAAVEVAAAAVA